MIPITGHRILPIDPDNQDDIYESQNIERIFEARDAFNTDDPRFYSSDTFELDSELSVKRKFIPTDLFNFIDTHV